MKKLLTAFVFLAFFTVSCNNTDTKKDTTKLDKQALGQLIKNFEKEVFNVPPDKLSKEKTVKLADYYVEYAKYKDSLAPEYLYKASGIYMNTGNPEKAAELLNRLIKEYPDFDKTENCYFLRAFVYDDKLKDYDKAKEYYEIYLKKYPKGEFADDAKILKENLGKSTEEIFKELQKKKK